MSDIQGEIIVTGQRIVPNEASVRFYTPSSVDGGSGGGGGGGGLAPPPPPNPPEHAHTETSECAEGAAKQIGEEIVDLASQLGGFEFRALISRNPDDSFGSWDQGIHTNNNSVQATLPFPSDLSNIVGLIHNHPWDSRTTTYNQNYQNRYPSGESGGVSGDWAVLDKFINPPDGSLPADPSKLLCSLLIHWERLGSSSTPTKSRTKV